VVVDTLVVLVVTVGVVGVGEVDFVEDVEDFTVVADDDLVVLVVELVRVAERVVVDFRVYW